MGNCISSASCSRDSVNLANERNPTHTESPFPDHPENQSLGRLSDLSHQYTLKDDLLVEHIEINNFVRPMLRRTLTITNTENIILDFSKSKTKLRRTNSIVSSPKRTSFLFKAKEKLKRQKTMSMAERKFECICEDLTEMSSVFKSTELYAKDDNYLNKHSGDLDTEVD